MENFIGDLLERVETTGQNFSERAYGIIGTQIMPLLTLMLVGYVAFYGLQLIMGTARISIGEIVGRVARMLLVVSLVGEWGHFNDLFYAWLSRTPEAVGRAILGATGTGISDPTSGLSRIWMTANQAASAFAEQSGYLSILPSMTGFLIMACVAVFLAVALAILLLSKVMMWVLIATAPIFIACMLFERTRGLGNAWFQQVLTYALIPLFVYVVAAFLISAMEPELTKVTSAAGERRLQLSDVSAFLLLCCAGAFVLFNIQTLAQGITGGVAAGIGRIARDVAGLAGVTMPRQAIGAARSGLGFAGKKLAEARQRTETGMKDNIRHSTANAMKQRISRTGEAA
jgi:type IV secretion system protein VirB6